MATFIANADGQVRVEVPLAGGDVASYGINYDNGQAFTPGQVVVIDDARLARCTAAVLATAGLVAAGAPDGP